ncbi:MAG TPA: lysylphosphatidylglycerol synthase domain-containing protein [Patescibacteria group bacterium]|jgi:uncharacterized membrane protein YbhN (UPF0104 family)|nr:lysylphosphatidylglycerol synthase domain-containing protein [Patescibacteria group bacterium]
MKKHLKKVLSLVIIATTIAAFSYYLSKHPNTVEQIKHIPPISILAILVLYGGSFIAYALVTRASLHIYDKHMGVQENFLFNAYSSLINFFGPGQSGPIFRGAYLKKRHNLGVKPYIFTLLIYYAFFGVISVMMMFVGSRPWWQTLILALLAGTGSIVILKWYRGRSALGAKPKLNLGNITLIFGATLLQLALQAVIFGIELHNVDPGVSIGQIMSYTGVANLAIFVALTPGAIGIRESFLLFSQNLHHINSSTIVAANVTDRAIYLLFLGILFVLVISLHAKDKLHVKQILNNS